MGVFRYVKFKRLLEAETGYTYNEPTEMAVTEAIEKGIHSLIIEGVMENLWSLKDTAQENSQVFKDYIKEKEDNLEEDLMGRSYEKEYRDNLYVSISGSGHFYNGDYSQSDIRPGGNLNFGFALNPSFYMEAGFGPHAFHIKNVYNSLEYAGHLDLMFVANTRDRYSPYLKTGVGTLYDFEDPVGVSGKKLVPYLSFGGGMEYLRRFRVGNIQRQFLGV
jgi:curli production assembly/transport component CsgG